MSPSFSLRRRSLISFRQLKCLFILLGALPYVLRAQKPDSLGSLLRKHSVSDTVKVRLYLSMADAYKQSNTDSTVYYAVKAKQLSYELGYNRGKLSSLNLLGNAYAQLNELDSANSCLQIALQLAKNTKDVATETSLLMSIGNMYYGKSNLDSALICYNNSITLARTQGDKRGEAGALMNIGCIYADKGRYSDALSNYLTALKIEEEGNYEEEQAHSLSNMATVYATMKDHKRALEYNNRSMAIFQKTGNVRGTISVMANEGLLYGELKEYEKSATFFRKAISRADSIGDLYWKYVCVVNLAEDCLELGQLDNALELFNDALKDAEKTNNYFNIGLSHFGIGKINERKGNATKAIKNFEKAFTVFRGESLYEQASSVASSLSLAYEQKHDLTNALLYHKYYTDLKDSCIKIENDKKIQQLQFDNELEKSEHSIKLLQAEQQIHKSKADKQRFLVYALASCMLLLLSIVLVLYRSRAMQKKTNTILLKQKQEIKEHVAELELLSQFRNKTFSVLSHDLRGPMSAFSVVMQLLKDGELSEEEFRGYLPDMSQKLNSITLLIENLLNWAKSSLDGGMVLKPVDVKLYKAVNKNIDFMLGMSSEKKISIKNNIPEALTAYCDQSHFDIVIRNLLVNAVKFSYPGSEIEVAAKAVNGKVELTVADKGVGITKEQVSNLFSATSHHSTYGTAGEKGTGIGLLLSFDYVKANKGTITAASEPGKGTAFTLVLPAHVG